MVAGELNVSMMAGTCSMLLYVASLANANRTYAEAQGGIYTYYRACMFSLFLLLRRGAGSGVFVCPQVCPQVVDN